MPPLLLICYTALACSVVRDDAKHMVRDDAKDMVRDDAKAMVRDDAKDMVRDDAKDMVRDDAKDMLRDWNDEVYQELTRAIEKELKLNMENPKVVQMPEKGTFKFLTFKKQINMTCLPFKTEIISYLNVSYSERYLETNSRDVKTSQQ